MLPLMEVVDANVDFRTAGHAARQLLAEEEIRIATQWLGAFDRVVIGQREKIHAAAPQQGIDLARIAIAFPAECVDKRRGAGAGEIGVNVHIAFHEFHSKFTGLHTDDMRAKILKTQVVN